MKQPENQCGSRAVSYSGLVSLPGACGASGNKPPAMRVRIEGFALARRWPPSDGVRYACLGRIARKGGHHGKPGKQPVSHEVDVQIPHRVRTEV